MGAVARGMVDDQADCPVSSFVQGRAGSGAAAQWLRGIPRVNKAGQGAMKVRLYLCRHGIAEEIREGMADEERPLTEEGTRKFKRTAGGIALLAGRRGGCVVFASPLVRAHQTAEMLIQALAEEKITADLKNSAHLAPPGNLLRFIKEARGAGVASVFAVGHEPVLSEWAGRLCFGKTGRLRMKKGAVAGIELEDTGLSGELLVLLQPGNLKRLTRK